MQEWLVTLATHYPYIIYGIIVVVACSEGPYLSMICGFLLRFGYFAFWPLYIALMVGDLIGDVIWYYIGRHYGHRFIARFGKYFNITEDNVGKVERVFHKYKHSILFISKISNGFGFALVTLVTAGMVKVPFWFYMLVNAIGQLIWSGLLIGVGYFFGHFYEQANGILAKMAVFAALVVVFALFMGYRKYLAKKAASINV